MTESGVEDTAEPTTSGTAATSTTVSTAPANSGPRSPWLWVSLVLVALLAATLGALAVTMHTISTKNARTSAEATARQAAINTATKMLSYSYQSFDSDMSWLSTDTTDTFKQQYKGTVETLKPIVIQVKEIAVGKITYAAANLQDTSHVTVLLAANQTLSTASGSAGGANQGTKQAASTLVFHMVKQKGRWLIDAVDGA